MHAVRAIRRGGPEVLEYGSVPDPHASPGTVLVRVEAAGVNFIDTYRRSGMYPMEFPHIVGSEGAGIIEAVGEGVHGFGPGDRVSWFDAPGSYAELVSVPSQRLLPVPSGVDPAIAAAVPLQGLTAQYLVTASHPIGPGSTALVHAAAGGVGLLLTQFITHLGGSVIGTVSTEEKAALARRAGARDIIVYGPGIDVSAQVRELTAGAGVDVVYDGVGHDTFDASLASLRVRGSLVLYGAASGAVPPFDIQRLNSGGGIFLSRPSLHWFVQDPEEFAQRAAMLSSGIREGWLSVHVGARFELADAAQAHQALEGRLTTGKVVLIP